MELLLRNVRLLEDEKETCKEEGEAQEAGTLAYSRSHQCLRIACVDGGALLCDSVQVAGKKETCIKSNRLHFREPASHLQTSEFFGFQSANEHLLT